MSTKHIKGTASESIESSDENVNDNVRFSAAFMCPMSRVTM
ncbi:hypothetical protein [Pantoea sp. At-9b]|nr:hypothetical protein [Pantoea sp. At-9b]ADU72325.1 hypothetical protein Pat9b_5042 [Pantoea sp. At-9b]